MERARAQAKGTSDVIENAAKWNIKVWKFEKVVAYVKDVKQKIGLKSSSSTKEQPFLRRAGSVDSGLNVATELRGPYIKFEETNFQFRPVFYEFKKFPRYGFISQLESGFEQDFIEIWTDLQLIFGQNLLKYDSN